MDEIDRSIILFAKLARALKVEECNQDIVKADGTSADSPSLKAGKEQKKEASTSISKRSQAKLRHASRRTDAAENRVLV